MLKSIETKLPLLAAAFLSAAIARGQTVDEIFNKSRGEAQTKCNPLVLPNYPVGMWCRGVP